MILGMLRVRNEARWIGRCLYSLLAVCDRVLLMDDHSTDRTLEIATLTVGVEAFGSPFEGLNEARDKNHLLAMAEALKPEWILAIDGDEMLSKATQEKLPSVLKFAKFPCLAPRIWYLWDAENQVRTDGVYGDFHRASIFKPNGTRFPVNGGGVNFHCGNVPIQLRQNRQVLELDILHFGYLYREDRLRKYEWYNRVDPENAAEDKYRHMAIGDLFPASSKFMHGGPLQLRTI